MHSTVARPSFATTTSNCDRRRVYTPQRKANYKDKTRLRLKDLKDVAFKKYGVSSTAEIKLLLTQLKIKLDLCLTSAWDAVCFELRSQILELPKVGDKVVWLNAPVHVESWGALKVEKIMGNVAQLELWYKPVPITELELAA